MSSFILTFIQQSSNYIFSFSRKSEMFYATSSRKSEMFLFQFLIFFVCHCLAPFIRSFFSRYFDCKMTEPAVRCCSVPVFYFGRNVNAVSRFHLDCFFSFFLIISTSGYAYKNLSAAALCMMNMPIVTTLNWTTPSQSPGFTGLNAIQNCVFCTLFDEVLLLSIFPFLQHPILLLPD